MANLPLVKVFSIGDLDFFSFGNFQAGGDEPHNVVQNTTETSVYFYDVYMAANFAEYQIKAAFSQNSINVTWNPDNSATVEIPVTVTRNRHLLTSLPPDSSGTGWEEQVQINGNQTHHALGLMSSLPMGEQNLGQQTSVITIPAQQESPDLSGVHWREDIRYIGQEFFDDFAFGLKVKNNKQPVYRPLAMRKGNRFVSLDNDGGFYRKHQNGAFVDIPKLNYGTVGQANQGNTRMRQGGEFKQQSRQGD